MLPFSSKPKVVKPMTKTMSPMHVGASHPKLTITVNPRNDWEPIQLSWNGNSKSYLLQIGTNENFPNPMVVSNLKGNTYKAELPPGKYFFRVRGLGKQHSAFSIPVSVTTLLDPSVTLFKNSDYIFLLSGDLNSKTGIPLHKRVHTHIKNASDKLDRTAGLYYTMAKVVIMCSSLEKSNALYNKYSAKRTALGDGKVGTTPAYQSVQIVNLPNNVDKFKFIHQQMETSYKIAHYRTSTGIGNGYNEQDFIFFLKVPATETLKAEASTYIDSYMLATPHVTSTSINRHLIIKKDLIDSINVLKATDGPGGFNMNWIIDPSLYLKVADGNNSPNAFPTQYNPPNGILGPSSVNKGCHTGDYNYINVSLYSADGTQYLNNTSISRIKDSAGNPIISSVNPGTSIPNDILTFTYLPDYKTDNQYATFKISSKYSPPSAHIMSWTLGTTSDNQSVSLVVEQGSEGIRPPEGTILNSNDTYGYCDVKDHMAVNVYENAYIEASYMFSTTIKLNADSFPMSYDKNGVPDGLITFVKIINDSGTNVTVNGDGTTIYNYTLMVSLVPPIITNSNWPSGMGNSESSVFPPLTYNNSYWVQDYGFNDFDRWTTKDGAIYQTTEELYTATQATFGSRAYPIYLQLNEVSRAMNGNKKLTGMDGVWQIDMKIGSDVFNNPVFCETFYIAERQNLMWGPQHYTDGSPAGGPGGYSREIDIMETLWNGGDTTPGPQVNIPNGNISDKIGNCGWNVNDPICPNGKRMASWSDLGDDPTSVFVTYGAYITSHDDKALLYFYAYLQDGTQWYAHPGIKINNPGYTQYADFVPYIGTWTSSQLNPSMEPGTFSTGYKNYVYLEPSELNGYNPVDNATEFWNIVKPK